jgi:hypothetical protein
MRSKARVWTLAIGLGLLGSTPGAGQTVSASVPGSGSDLRARSEALESEGDLLGAAALLEAALAAAPGDAQLHWRIARDLLRHAERHPQLEAEARLALYERAHAFARDGRALAPDCAECCLYEFASVGRLASERGITRAVGSVREAGRLVGECLANPPRHRDASGSEEAALYFGASVFYRSLPDSDWFRWATGQSGDSLRAVELARRAVGLEVERARYRLELGAALLCDGARSEDAARVAEGWRWVESVSAGTGEDAMRARSLRASAPSGGCALSHDEPRS